MTFIFKFFYKFIVLLFIDELSLLFLIFNNSASLPYDGMREGDRRSTLWRWFITTHRRDLPQIELSLTEIYCLSGREICGRRLRLLLIGSVVPSRRNKLRSTCTALNAAITILLDVESCRARFADFYPGDERRAGGITWK